MLNSPIVKFDNNGITIDGKYKVLLCASLFYFRIPRELWRDRITKIKKVGYNCVDVYFPWNFHELSPNEWSFSGQGDVEEFLAMLAEEKMYVIARPGPYICSEWDGGAIPAWVLTGSEPIREANKGFLDNVKEWYSRILPIIAKYQYGEIGGAGGAGGVGSIISVQLDNELDFFDCPDPKAYISELRDIAFKHDITVPVFGCAGQGCAERATGFAKDVEIAFNLYPDSRDPNFEELCLAAYKRMKGIGKPLLVTETNRDGFVLRRELACGAKLLGAYNQVGGTNFGFTNAVNNWGKGDSPLAFITSDYNFKSNISPAGEFDEDVLEGRLISALISTFGDALACAEPVLDHGFNIETNFQGPKIGFPALKLKAGGWLISIPNTGDKCGIASITGNDVGFKIEVEPTHAPFFPIGIPLEKWHIEGSIEWASAEIAHIYEDCEAVHIIMYSNKNGNVVLKLPGARTQDGEYIEEGKVNVSGVGTCCVLKQGKRLIKVVLLSRELASRYEIGGGVWEAAVPSLRKAASYNGDISLLRNLNIWTNLNEHAKDNTEYTTKDNMKENTKENSKVNPNNIAKENTKKNTQIAPLEHHGLWRGFGLYRIHAVPGKDILLMGAGDVISAYNDSEYLDTRISGCQWQLYSGRKCGEWSFRTEIWGHSNFDDSRLKGMKLKSSKGISAAFEILKTEDISGCWSFNYLEGDAAEALKKPLGGFEPLLYLNSWNTTRTPVHALYRRKVLPEPGSDSLVFHIEGNSATAKVYVNGSFIEDINRLDSYVDISNFMTPGKEIEIAVAVVKKDWNEPVGKPKLLHCQRINSCDLSLLPDNMINEVMKGEVEPASFPIRPQPGEVLVLSVDMDKMEKNCAYAKLEGRNVKITASFNNNVVGRIFLEGDTRPSMAGGDPLRMYLPGPWFCECGNKLKLLVEAIGSEPVISGISLEYV